MTDYDLNGPWTGNALHAPATPRHYRRAHLSLTVRIYITLAVLIVIGCALWGADWTLPAL